MLLLPPSSNADFGASEAQTHGLKFNGSSGAGGTAEGASRDKKHTLKDKIVEDLLIGQGEVLVRSLAPEQGAAGAGSYKVARKDMEFSDRKCAYLVHFINLFRDRRSVLQAGEFGGMKGHSDLAKSQEQSLQDHVLPVLRRCQQQQSRSQRYYD
jgi:hypothetical protein